MDKLERLHGMLLGALAGDSLALGVHWIYDFKWLQEQFGRVEEPLSPGKNTYHPTKKRGDFTHYGDQILCLMESMVREKGFELLAFARDWREMFRSYTGYRDQATRITFENLEKGLHCLEAGSFSNDLAGAIRAVPIYFAYYNDLGSMIEKARAQTSLTHRDQDTLLASEFFGRVLWEILNGKGPVSAIVDTSKHFLGTQLEVWIKKGLYAQGDPIDVIIDFGQSCHAPEAFPGIVYLIKRYEYDLKEAMVQAVMAGGDNATRASGVGMVLGAFHGKRAIPSSWLQFNNKEKIDELIRELTRLSCPS